MHISMECTALSHWRSEARLGLWLKADQDLKLRCCPVYVNVCLISQVWVRLTTR